MNRTRLLLVVIPFATLSLATASSAQDNDGVYWHIDPQVKTCSMVIDPSLTQSQWETFTRQAGAILTFKSLAPAEPLGKWHYTVGIDYSVTPVDQHDPAWINTFTHPDADCPLGDQISLPAIRARLGISRNMDVGAYWTTAPGANYGLAGGELRHTILGESRRIPSVAASASATWLTGVPDFNFSVYSVGLAASKRLAMFTPYLGFRGSLATGTETTNKVDLKTERHPLAQGFLGATYSMWRLGLGAEFNLADVNTFALVLAFHSRNPSP